MRRFAATVTAFLLASAALAQEAPPATPAAADAPSEAAAAPRGIVCGEPYVIRRGDTLQRLAVRVYGPEATFHALWAANRERLGLRDPSLIEIGQTIIAPCPISVTAALQAQTEAEAAQPMAEAGAPSDGAAPADDAGASGAAPEADASSVVAAPAADAARIIAAPAADAATGAAAPVVATAAAPPSAPESGAAAQPDPEPQPALTVLRLPGAPLAQAVALRALDAALGADGFAVADAPDAAATAGLRFPMAPPDCDGAERLECEGFLWSAPLLEQALVWHARAGASPLTTQAALAGLRICRADNAPRAVLAAPPDAQVQDGGPTRACLVAVAEGRADVAVSEAGAADAALRDAALAAAVAEQPALTTLVTLAAAAPKDDPLARAALAALDLGLARMRASGAWFAQVDAALSLR